MNTLHRYAVVSAVAAMVASPALGVESRAGASGALTLAKQEPVSGSSEEVTGTVAEIDQSTGTLALYSRGGTLRLHFPPRFIAGVRKGDTVTAWLAISKIGPGVGSTRAYDAPMGSGQHRMTGTVSRIDHESGWVYVKCGQTPLDLRFPPQVLQGLKEGDEVGIDLAFSKGS